MSGAQPSAFIDDELELCDLIAHLPAITIAAIRGVCIGNAAELALSCDLRVACDDAAFAWRRPGLMMRTIPSRRS